MKNTTKLIFILTVLQACLIVFTCVNGCINSQEPKIEVQHDSTAIIDSVTIDTTIDSITTIDSTSTITKNDTTIFEKVYLAESPILYKGCVYTYFLGKGWYVTECN